MHQWLVNELIPKVVFDYEESIAKENYQQMNIFKRIFKKNESIKYKDFISTYNASHYVIFDYKSYSYKNEKEHLVNIVNKLQSFYRGQKDLFISLSKLINLYEGIIILLKNGTRLNLQYLRSNLNDLVIDGALTSSSLIYALNKKIESLQEGTTNEFRIDLILRCFIVLLEDNINIYDDKCIENIKNKLDDVITQMDLLEIRDRQLKRFQ